MTIKPGAPVFLSALDVQTIVGEEFESPEFPPGDISMGDREAWSIASIDKWIDDHRKSSAKRRAVTWDIVEIYFRHAGDRLITNKHLAYALNAHLPDITALTSLMAKAGLLVAQRFIGAGPGKPIFYSWKGVDKKPAGVYAALGFDGIQPESIDHYYAMKRIIEKIPLECRVDCFALILIMGDVDDMALASRMINLIENAEDVVESIRTDSRKNFQ